MDPSVLIVGSINMDVVARVKTLPLPGQTLIGHGYAQNPGGKGANCAVAAARMGAKVTFAGCVGRDANGPVLREVLRSDGIDTRYLAVTEKAGSGFADILVSDEGQNCIVVVPGANEHIPVPMLNTVFEEEYDVLMMQLEINHDAFFAAAAHAKRKNIPIVIDAGPAQSFPLERVEGMLILSPNETETTALTGLPVSSETEAAFAARVLYERTHPQFVVIKMGARGAYVFGRDDQGTRVDEMVPAFSVKAVDPTAAGDTFTAALTVSYLRTRDILYATRYGCAAGAIACTRHGAQRSLPSRGETEEFLRAHAQTIPL